MAKDGFQDNHKVWLVSAGWFKGIEVIRGRFRFEPMPGDITEQMAANSSEELDGEGIEDDRLWLIIT